MTECQHINWRRPPPNTHRPPPTTHAPAHLSAGRGLAGNCTPNLLQQHRLWLSSWLMFALAECSVAFGCPRLPLGLAVLGCNPSHNPNPNPSPNPLTMPMPVPIMEHNQHVSQNACDAFIEFPRQSLARRLATGHPNGRQPKKPAPGEHQRNQVRSRLC